MSRLVIYTCITGAYDSLQQPCPAPEGIDFIQFVAKGVPHGEYNGVWKVEQLPASWDDPVITSRFPKLSPQSLLEEYDYSLWIDGNVRIANPQVYEICLALMEKDVKYAGIRHPVRDCAYDEAEKVLKDDRDSLCQLLHTVRYLKEHNLPRHAGLMENNVIFRKHNDPVVVKFDRLWQERFLHHSPRRDQLVHSLCRKDVPELKVEFLLPEGVNTMNSDLFEYRKHPAPALSFLQRKWKYGRLWPARWILGLYLKSVK